MAGLLRHKVVAISGSSSGIGRATALACARQGASLVLHHLGDGQAEADIATLEDELRVINTDIKTATHASDLTHADAASALVYTATSRLGSLDVIVNNAGICKFSSFQDVTRALLERHMEVNFTAAYLLTQAGAKQMIQQSRGGSIVNIASITATLGSAHLTHYSPTKAAILGMTGSFSVALGSKNIRINSICPGTIETTMNKADLDTGTKRAEMASRVPLCRLGRPEDIAKAVVFFASDLSEYVTGQSLLVDGGASINYQ
ncbi:Sugar dehydrogenase [Recurvomyces mirabilis]|uniref:Sugar dehydrogenase n=1 Tax=Recurvomyces mirabilis TaxID=574656 RepID=A0AAE0TPD3_9PEZI|nr:Sugar dehydrogenase [Recurvomyces mirabilis]KAK5149493.1 hypothetical protein LTS14_010903 [Recurvomyces mirabilis]